MTKHDIQLEKAHAGIELLHNITANCLTYEELQRELNIFVRYINKTANEKNTAPNKSIIALKEYYEAEAPKQREVKTVKGKATAKRLLHKKSYKDYRAEILILRKRGYSYQSISDYCKQHFKVKVSKTTVGEYIRALEAEAKND